MLEYHGNIAWIGNIDNFSQGEIGQIFSGCQIVRYKKHEFIFRNDDLSQSIHYIKSGKLVQYMYLPNGKRRILSFHAPGSMIGLVAAFSELPSINDCEAYTDCVLMRCSSDLFLQRLNELGLVRKYMRMEARKSYYLQLRMGLLGDQCDITLVSDLLDEGLTQQEIGDFLGVSRVHVARLCRLLRQNKRLVEDGEDDRRSAL